MKIRCITIGEYTNSLNWVEWNIRQVPYMHQVGRYANVTAAEQALQSQAIDLAILDIQLPNSEGLRFTAQHFPGPLVIFVTTCKDYAVEAFEAGALDYLLKPVTFERFLQAMNKAFLFCCRRHPVDLSDRKEPGSGYIFVYIEYKLVKIILADILYIEARKDYVRIHLRSDARPLVTRSTLKGIQDLLPAHQFVRIHRSFIVSVSDISVIKKEWLTLKGVAGDLPISDGFKDNINGMFK